MNKKRLRLGLLALLFLVSTFFALGAIAATQAAKDLKISGPYNSGNLSVFLIHGKDQIKGQTYLTLQEALDQKKVVVHETGDVNQLTVDNLCGSVVFIQSGDIVKGGRQDRTMQNDVLLQPHEKNVPLSAFCVEHGRWSERQGEAADNFASSGYAISGKSLKLAAKRNADQSAVWSEVASYQEKLSREIAKPVASPASPSSYQLTLENKVVKNATQKLVNDLQSAANREQDVVGYAFAINGYLNSADVYASNALFKKLWPKLLNSSAVEAVAEGAKKAAKPVTSADVQACLDDAEKAPKTFTPQPRSYSSYSQAGGYAAGAGGANNERRQRADFETSTHEDARNIMFSTLDKKANVTVHKNYVSK